MPDLLWRPELPEEISAIFQSENLSLLGIAPVDPAPELQREYQIWLEKGHHGSMAYMQRHAAAKYEPRAMLEGCQSILFAGLNYYQHRPESTSKNTGKIARYAWGRDYHKVLGKRLLRVRRKLEELYPDHQFRNFTDATPLSERYYAGLAGIGFQGRNTLLISSRYGSWFVIGEILSSLDFADLISLNQEHSIKAVNGNPHGDCPRSCRKCIDVCPTQALYAPHRIDASRCISYLTIEHKGSIPEELRPLMQDWIFGCDLCQDVCPLNVRRQVTSEADFIAVKAGPELELKEILEIPDSDAFTKRFAGSPLMRAGRSGLVRNACIAAANKGSVELLPLLEKLTHDADPVISEHASWAVHRLISQ
ncbi:tRNA epoxyqueuosine(34) reductase QueG [Spirochaeta dissipatitropha]